MKQKGSTQKKRRKKPHKSIDHRCQVRNEHCVCVYIYYIYHIGSFILATMMIKQMNVKLSGTT
jgi:hypothetical protein